MELFESAVLLTPADLGLRLKLLTVEGQFVKSRGEWL